MLIKESEVPAIPETMTCHDHGDYQVVYTKLSEDMVIRSAACKPCHEAGQKKAEEDSKKEQQAAQKERRQRRLIKAGVSKRLIDKTFDDYIADTEGKLKAKAKCEAVTVDILSGRPTASLILSGGVGTGKTALCAAMASQLVDTKTMKIKTAINLVRDLKETWGKDSEHTEKSLIKYYSNIDLLVIDEIGVQYGSETEKLFLFDIIDGRYNEMKPTVLISNLGIDAIKEAVGERIIDRLREDGGALIKFDWDSYRK